MGGLCCGLLSGTLVLGTFAPAAGWRFSCRAGRAEAEEPAEAVAPALGWGEADGLAEGIGCGPELTVRFTSVPRSTGVPAA